MQGAWLPWRSAGHRGGLGAGCWAGQGARPGVHSRPHLCGRGGAAWARASRVLWSCAVCRPTHMAVQHACRPLCHHDHMMPPGSCTGPLPSRACARAPCTDSRRDLMSRHAQKPLHIAVGGGDQVRGYGAYVRAPARARAPAPAGGGHRYSLPAIVHTHLSAHPPPLPQLYCDQVWSSPSMKA